MSEVFNRIVGSEMEYGINAMLRKAVVGDSLLINSELITGGDLGLTARAYLRQARLATLQCGAGDFLSNGARFYPDCGYYEYATPEDTNLKGFVANEIVGERIIQGVADSYSLKNGVGAFVTKRVIDEAGKTWGYHNSFSADAKSELSVTAEGLSLFGVFAATRNILFGAGTLLSNGDFSIGQKSLNLSKDFDAGTINQKPVVNLRSESLADESEYLRIHDTSVDPVISPWAMAVGRGAASIVIRLMENGITLSDKRFHRNLYDVAKLTALDHQLKRRFRLQSGAYSTALSINEMMIVAAKELYKENGLSSEEEWALHEWEKAVQDLGQDRKLVEDRVEWVMKLRCLNRQHDKHGWSWDSRDLRLQDLLFSDLGKHGIGLKLRESTWAKHMPSADLISDRLHNPPETTRALIRGNFIKRHRGNKKYRAYWDSISTPGHLAYMKDPFETTPIAAERFIKKKPTSKTTPNGRAWAAAFVRVASGASQG